MGRSSRRLMPCPLAWLRSLLPLPQHSQSPPREGRSRGLHGGGESQGPGLKVGRGTKTLEFNLSSGAERQSWGNPPTLLSTWGWDRRHHLSDSHVRCFPCIFRTLVCAGLVTQQGHMVCRGDGGDATAAGHVGEHTP